MPYTDEQWAEIETLGHAIDADLNKGDVRLTMGGEPTFVSIDDPDGPEWNFTAVSHKKRILSGELIKRLRETIRARLAAALRPGQMVSRRTAAALGARGATGARTACRSGRTIRSSPTNPRITATARRTRRNCSTRIAERRRRGSEISDCRPTRTRFITLGRNAAFRRTSRRKNPISRTSWSATASRGFSSRALAKSSATRCRSSARGMATSRAGCPARGFCATTTRSGSFPAIRRWACACRSIPFRGLRKRIIRGCGSRIRRSRNCRNCRRNFRIAPAGSTGQRFMRGGGAPLPAGYGPRPARAEARQARKNR